MICTLYDMYILLLFLVCSFSHDIGVGLHILISFPGLDWIGYTKLLVIL